MATDTTKRLTHYTACALVIVERDRHTDAWSSVPEYNAAWREWSSDPGLEMWRLLCKRSWDGKPSYSFENIGLLQELVNADR